MAHLSLTQTPISEILTSLKQSDFRAKFRLNTELRAYAQRLGHDKLKVHTVEILNTRLAPPAKANDGKQTPMKGHPVFIAQHACGLCCRGCLSKWYGVDPKKALTQDEVFRAADILTTWIESDLKLPPKPQRRSSVETRQASFDF